MKLFYTDHYEIPLPEGHRFPRDKNQLLRNALLREAGIAQDRFHPSPLAKREEILLVHSAAYTDGFLNGTLPPQMMRRIGMPWSAEYVQRTQATMGGAVASMRSALEHGFSGQLAGGTHHAHADFGSGFCALNDFALAAETARREALADRIAIIDLDVHQGDGNASIFAGRSDIFVFSLHAEKNFPFRKYRSHLDIALPDGAPDDIYLHNLREGLEAVISFRPDLVLYLCGVDPLVHDRLGRLAISYEGLAACDRLVFEQCRRAGIAVSIGLGGGYCNPIEQSVAAYMNTIAQARAIYNF